MHCFLSVFKVLASYDTSRRRHNLAIMASIDTLHRLFRDDGGDGEASQGDADGSTLANTTSSTAAGAAAGRSAGGPRLTVAALPAPLRGAAVAARELGLGVVNALPPLKQVKPDAVCVLSDRVYHCLLSFFLLFDAFRCWLELPWENERSQGQGR
jgi:hypothetical protein